MLNNIKIKVITIRSFTYYCILFVDFDRINIRQYYCVNFVQRDDLFDKNFQEQIKKISKEITNQLIILKRLAFIILFS